MVPMMKQTLKNPLLVAAALAIGFSGCTKDTSESDYKNVSNQETAVVDEQSVNDSNEHSDNQNSQDVGSDTKISAQERLASAYSAIDSYVENQETSHLAYSQDHSITFLAYDPSLAQLYLQLDEGASATLTVNPLVHSYGVFDVYSQDSAGQSLLEHMDPSVLEVNAPEESRVILDVMSDVYAPFLYSPESFDPEQIRFGYDDRTLDSFVEETERYPIYDAGVKAQAAEIMESIPTDNQDNPYHVLTALQDWIEETNGTTQGYVTLARTYGIPAQEFESYTPEDGKVDVAAVYLEPYGWMLTNPHQEGSLDNFVESGD